VVRLGGYVVTSVGGEHLTKISHNFRGLNLADKNYFSFVVSRKTNEN
jgi:hypothetical protein